MLGLCLHSTSGGGGSTSIVFNRPSMQQPISYYDYDEGWHYVNDTDPYNNNIVEGDTKQELADGDYWKVKFDDSSTTGITEHLFRFVGPTGGYIDSNLDYYDIDGNSSTKAAQFTKDGSYYLIDRLTGIGWALEYSETGDTYQNLCSSIQSLSRCGYTDWWVPTAYQFMTIAPITTDPYGYSLTNRLAVGEPWLFNNVANTRFITCTVTFITTQGWQIDSQIQSRLLNANLSSTTYYAVAMRYHYT